MMREVGHRRALRGLAGLFTALSLLLWLPSVGAGSFSVKPVRVTLSADKKVASLEVQNNGDSETSIQLETVAWTQEPSGDVYKLSETLLATPPIFTLAPGETQIVRVGLRRLPSADQELPFRLFLTEIPPPAKKDFHGLQMALRLGVPVFLQPTTEIAPELHWRAKNLNNGHLQLQVTNRGNAHAKLDSASLQLPSGEHIQGTASGYILPGYKREWEIEPVVEITPGDRLALETRVNGNTRSVTVPVE